MKTIQTVRTEKGDKVYYTLSSVERRKLFNIPIEVVYSREKQGKFGPSVFVIAKLPEGFRPVYDLNGDEVEAEDCTTVGFSLPVRVRDGKEYGAGIELLELTKGTEKGQSTKVIMQEESATNNMGSTYKTYKVIKA
jgi:hypothetical protein